LYFELCTSYFELRTWALVTHKEQSTKFKVQSSLVIAWVRSNHREREFQPCLSGRVLPT